MTLDKAREILNCTCGRQLRGIDSQEHGKCAQCRRDATKAARRPQRYVPEALEDPERILHRVAHRLGADRAAQLADCMNSWRRRNGHRQVRL